MSVQDGQEVELVLRPGAYPEDYFDPQLRGKSIERSAKGIVRSFQTESRFDPITGEQVVFPETRWEVVTTDPAYPAIGFDPATAEFK